MANIYIHISGVSLVVEDQLKLSKTISPQSEKGIEGYYSFEMKQVCLPQHNWIKTKRLIEVIFPKLRKPISSNIKDDSEMIKPKYKNLDPGFLKIYFLK